MQRKTERGYVKTSIPIVKREKRNKGKLKKLQ